MCANDLSKVKLALGNFHGNVPMAVPEVACEQAPGLEERSKFIGRREAGTGSLFAGYSRSYSFALSGPKVGSTNHIAVTHIKD